MVVVVGQADTAVSSSQDRETLRSHQTPPANRRRRDIQSTPGSTPSSTRVSPYPLRERTPRQLLSPSAAPVHQQARVSLDASPANPVHHVADQHRLQLVVQPLVKDTVGSRDSSARMLDVFAANGATFGDIMHKIWEQFSSRVKGLAVKKDDTWSIDEPTEAAWYKSMQFKWNGHLIPPTKTEVAWNRWLTQRRDDTVTLLIYEYGLGIPSARALEEFKDARIRPQHTDRSGAAAEASIREIVAKLQEIWGETYQGSAMAWRMWANEVMRNLDRSTWEVDIYDPPTATVERLLRAADGEAEIHLTNLSRSARLALDVVNGAIADNRQLKNDWEAFGRRLDNQENVLRARRDTLEGFLEDIPIPPVTDVIDPMPAMENVPDTEHEP